MASESDDQKRDRRIGVGSLILGLGGLAGNIGLRRSSAKHRASAIHHRAKMREHQKAMQDLYSGSSPYLGSNTDLDRAERRHLYKALHHQEQGQTHNTHGLRRHRQAVGVALGGLGALGANAAYQYYRQKQREQKENMDKTANRRFSLENAGRATDAFLEGGYKRFGKLSPSGKAIIGGAAIGGLHGALNNLKHEGEGRAEGAVRGAVSGAGVGGIAELATRKFRKTAEAFFDEIEKQAEFKPNKWRAVGRAALHGLGGDIAGGALGMGLGYVAGKPFGRHREAAEAVGRAGATTGLMTGAAHGWKTSMRNQRKEYEAKKKKELSQKKTAG